MPCVGYAWLLFRGVFCYPTPLIFLTLLLLLCCNRSAMPHRCVARTARVSIHTSNKISETHILYLAGYLAPHPFEFAVPRQEKMSHAVSICTKRRPGRNVPGLMYPRSPRLGVYIPECCLSSNSRSEREADGGGSSFTAAGPAPTSPSDDGWVAYVCR
jgi:hypothetical protein